MTDHLARALTYLRGMQKMSQVMSVTFDRDECAALSGHVESFERRERDLLEANNRYLERARRAEAGVLTSEDGEFQIIASEAVKVAHMVNLFEHAIVNKNLGPGDAGYMLHDYCCGVADESETIGDLRKC